MKKYNLDILKKYGSGFKTPKKYFDSIENEVLSKLTVENFPEKEGFHVPENYFKGVDDQVFEILGKDVYAQQVDNSVPEGYFDTLEENVFKKLKEEKLIEPKVIPLRSKFIKILTPLAIAASLLLFFIVNYNNNKFTMENVASSEIDSWIEDDLIVLDANQIAEVFSDVTLNEEVNIEDAELLEYLNGTDIESILNN